MGAVIDFSQVTTVSFRAFSEGSPQAGYVKLWHAKTLAARHVTKLHCEVTGSWPLDQPAVFEGHVVLGIGIDVSTSLVLSDHTRMGSS